MRPLADSEIPVVARVCENGTIGGVCKADSVCKRGRVDQFKSRLDVAAPIACKPQMKEDRASAR